MSILTDMLKRLTDLYNRETGGNIAKLLRLPATEMESLQETIDRTGDWRDIDQAEGKTLDRIGINVVELRGGKSDADYRQTIKTKIAANISDGSMTKLYQIIGSLMPGADIEITEGWNSSDPQPAAILIVYNNSGVPIPFEPASRIVAAGVSIEWAYHIHESTVGIIPYYTSNLFDYMHYCGVHDCGTVPDIATIGQLYDIGAGAQMSYNPFAFTYLQCGVHDCGTVPEVGTVGAMYVNTSGPAVAFVLPVFDYLQCGVHECGAVP